MEPVACTEALSVFVLPVAYYAVSLGVFVECHEAMVSSR